MSIREAVDKISVYLAEDNVLIHKIPARQIWKQVKSKHNSKVPECYLWGGRRMLAALNSKPDKWLTWSAIALFFNDCIVHNTNTNQQPNLTIAQGGWDLCHTEQ